MSSTFWWNDVCPLCEKYVNITKHSSVRVNGQYFHIVCWALKQRELEERDAPEDSEPQG